MAQFARSPTAAVGSGCLLATACFLFVRAASAATPLLTDIKDAVAAQHTLLESLLVETISK
ncbi:MAG: hypothetical protein SGJ09_09065 [Phycisphaerae bacterium]|nr:hypothetical protein [Phycisphaerae bacterium]